MTRVLNQPDTRAFTLVELLVAIAVSMLLLSLVSYLFIQSSNIASRGVATSRLIGNARAITEQMRFDTRTMASPTDDGFLVIIQREVAKTDGTPPDLLESSGALVTSPRLIRSDQLLFVRHSRGATALRPICPSSRGTFSPPPSSASFAIVWYGHVLRTDDRGVASSGSRLGDAGHARADRWILGRQARFLDPDADGVSAIYATSTQATATVTYPGGLPHLGATLRLHYGLTDLCRVDLATLTASFGTTVPTYLSGALDVTYSDFLDHPLHVNPAPLFDSTAPTYNYASWQIAQIHPMLMDNVSDFLVEFAGDYDGDGDIDVVTSTDSYGTTGQIKWYSGYPHDPSASTEFPASFLAQHSVTAFKDHTGLPTGGGIHDEAPIYDDSTGDYRAFVFRHDDDGVNCRWPAILRIRYRVHDPNGRVVGRTGETGEWFEEIVQVQLP